MVNEEEQTKTSGGDRPGFGCCQRRLIGAAAWAVEAGGREALIADWSTLLGECSNAGKPQHPAERRATQWLLAELGSAPVHVSSQRASFFCHGPPAALNCGGAAGGGLYNMHSTARIGRHHSTAQAGLPTKHA